MRLFLYKRPIARLKLPLLMLKTSFIASGSDLSENGSSPPYSSNNFRICSESSSKRSCASGKNEPFKVPSSLCPIIRTSTASPSLGSLLRSDS